MTTKLAAAGAAGLILGAAAFIHYQNNALEFTVYQMKAGLDKPMKIIHLSDLHGKEYNEKNKDLYMKIVVRNPDLIVATGDMIDDQGLKMDSVAEFLGSLKRRAPVFYIPGNHEHRCGLAGIFSEKLREQGVTVLWNSLEHITIGETPVSLLGFNELDLRAVGEDTKLLRSLEKQEGLRLLLSHYPENFALKGKSSYGRYRFDLMLSGHAHGGQVILPWIGGLYAPGQGFNPPYYGGMYGESPKLVVSRGLGGVEFPPRLFNRPEIVEIIIS